MNQCPACGSVIDVQDAAFCSECGVPLGAGAKPETFDGKNAGVIPSGDPPAPGFFSSPRPPAASSPIPAPPVVPEPTTARDATATDNLPIGLQINDNHFYMEKHVGILDLRFTNRHDQPIRDVLIKVRGEHLGPARECRVDLPPGESCRRRLQLLPGIAGEHLVELSITCEIDGRRSHFTADPTLKVLQDDVAPTNVTLVIDQRMQAGQNIGYGMSVRNEVADGIAKDLMKTPNDLLSRQFPDSWQPISLSVRFETPHPPVPPAAPPVAAGKPVSVPARLSIVLAGGSPAVCNLGIMGRATLSMGRTRSACDLVLRVLPRSEANDRLSLRISGNPHLSLLLRPRGLMLRDHGSSNGTTLNGHAVVGEMSVPLHCSSDVNVAGSIQLRLIPLLEQDSSQDHSLGISATDMGDGLWRLAQNLGLRAVFIERLDNLAAAERYIVVYRWFDLGWSGADMLLDPRTSPPAAVHGACLRILRLDGKFWLECLAAHPPLRAPQGVLPIGWKGPLVAGQKLELGSLLFETREFCQVGL